MKFLADECCDAELVLELRNEGHDVIYVMESMSSSPDNEVLQKAYLERRILITEDKDFGELVFRLKMQTRGIILLRFQVTDRNIKWPKLQKLIRAKSEDLFGKFVVIDKNKARLISL